MSDKKSKDEDFLISASSFGKDTKSGYDSIDFKPIRKSSIGGTLFQTSSSSHERKKNESSSFLCCFRKSK